MPNMVLYLLSFKCNPVDSVISLIILLLQEDEKNLEEHEEIMEAMKKQKRWEYFKTMPLDVEKYVSYGDYNPKGSGFQARRVPWDNPSHTLTERGLQLGTCAHLHPGQHRGFTPLEAGLVEVEEEEEAVESDPDELDNYDWDHLINNVEISDSR